MKNFLFSTNNKNTANLALFILRIGFGALMVTHGWAKLMNFEKMQESFMDFMGLGATVSLSLVIFSEFFCSILLMIGFLTRWATIPLIVTAIVISSAHQWDFFGESELGSAYLVAYISILLLGPGKYSLDNFLVLKRR
ncbi:DoxX family protein [Flavobacterium sp. I3-2]|uniref:DoxX family protein n=1 Tax=Flavobacterium sp. I3-2 TaxID=2748319 RepID=UPI0015A7F641|nr:DoxX family protein [Flavobacterium sp. I3-2]